MNKSIPQSYYHSNKLNWFLPDGFSFIRELQLKKPTRYDDLINLSIGAPNRPTPNHICDVLVQELKNPKYHTYAPQFGAPELCEAVAEWYKSRFGVNIDSRKEVLITVGIKEAIFNTVHALVNPGDVVLVPDPGYPTYFEAVTFCGGKMITYDSNQGENETLSSIKEAAQIHKPKFVFVNYPSNPTGRIVTERFYRELQLIANELNFVVLSDLAYSEIAFDGKTVSSYFQGSDSIEGAIEFFAFSKTYNMAGWRVGAIVADESLLHAIKMYKSKIDSNVFYPIQLAAVEALNNTEAGFYSEQSKMYQRRREILFDGICSVGIEAVKPEGAMYLWTKVPTGYDSWSFTKHLYDNCGVLCVPGSAYGANGKSYVRLGLVLEEDKMKEAVIRIEAGMKYLT